MKEGNAVTSLIKSKEELKKLFINTPESVLRQFSLVQFRKDYKLIEKGSDNRYIYILCKGSYRVINEFRNGRVFEFSSSSDRDPDLLFCGLLEFFSDQRIATSTIVTGSQSTFIKISKKEFAHWLDNDFPAYKKIVKIFANQIYPSHKKMGTMKVFSGLYSLVNYLVVNYGSFRKGEKEHIVAETREQLSAELGISIRTVYRLCRELNDLKMITVEKKKIKINQTNIEDLTKLLEEVY